MNNKEKKKILSNNNILLLLVGILINYDKFKVTGSHSAMADSITIWVIIYSVILIITLAKNLIKIKKKKEKFDFIPLIITLVVFVIAWSSKFDFYKSKSVMSAYLDDSLACYGIVYRKLNCRSIYIDFKINNKCLVDFQGTDGGEIKKYPYNIIRDTIVFDNSIIEGSDSALTNKYLIDNKNKILKPIYKSKIKLIPLKIINNGS